MDLIAQAKRQITDLRPTACRLHDSACRFLDKHILAYGTGHVRPKHHWLLDIASQVIQDGVVIDAFVVERQHLFVKRVAEPVRNTRMFERSVLSSMCTVLFEGQADFADGLKGRTGSWSDFPGAQVANRMAVGGLDVAAGDLVFGGECTSFVVACASEAGVFYAVVEVLVLGGRVGLHACRVGSSGHHELWPGTELSLALAWYREPAGTWVALRM